MGLLRTLVFLLELRCSPGSFLLRHGSSGISLEIPRRLPSPSNLVGGELQMFLYHLVAEISAQVFILPAATFFWVLLNHLAHAEFRHQPISDKLYIILVLPSLWCLPLKNVSPRFPVILAAPNSNLCVFITVKLMIFTSRSVPSLPLDTGECPWGKLI